MARRPRVPSRLIRSAADERAVSLGYWFDEPAAAAVAAFSREFCRHSQGRWAGDRFELQPWQYVDLVEPVYGWKRPDGSRRYRRVLAEIPKKNGKSALASVLSLYHTIGDGEQGAVVGNCAVDSDQAGLVFDVAAAMVRASPDLAAALDVIDSRKTIVHPASGSRYFALSSDVAKAEGMNLSALVLDELHRWRGEMFNTLYHAGAARRQPMFLMLTTAGTFDEVSIGWQQHTYGRLVLDGTVEDLAFFAYIRAADPAADWLDPATWAAANPSIGVTVTLEELAEQCGAAQHSVGLENAFKRYRLNLWTQSTEAWLSLATFDASAGHAIDESAYIGQKFFGGFDVGGVSDLSVVAELFPCPHDPLALDLVLRAFLPEAALREGKNADLYETWRRAGLLTVTPGTVTDEPAIVSAIVADAARFGCHSIAIDRLFNAMRLSQDLSAAGLAIFPCGMGFMSLSPLVTELEKRLLAKTLHHGGHPILRNAIDAVEMEVDAAGNRKPSRANRSKKIDALIAVLLALDRQLREPAKPAEPTYQMLFFGGRRR